MELRAVLGERAACLGFGGGRGVDARRNAGVEGEGGVVVDIGFEGEQGGEKRILVCRTDEQVRGVVFVVVRWLVLIRLGCQCVVRDGEGVHS